MKVGLFEKMDSNLGKIKSKVKDVYEKQQERKFATELSNRINQIPSQLSSERRNEIKEVLKEREAVRKDEKRVTELKQEANKIKREAIRVKMEKLSSFGEKTLSKPLLKKPSVSVPSYNANKFVSNLATNQGQLAREVPQIKARLPVTSRSTLFDNEASSEIKRATNWLYS
jgi:hypothetical protein